MAGRHLQAAAGLFVSVETRTGVGESYDPLRSLFEQFELIYWRRFAEPARQLDSPARYELS